MKLVYVITRSDVMGGASVHLLDLAKGMKDLGHTVVVLIGGQGIVVDRARQLGIDCRSLKFLVREISPCADIRGYFELLRALADLKPDLVHLHSAKAGILGRLVAKRLSVPAVYTAHGWPFTEGVSEAKRKLYAVVERAMANISDRIITVSEYDRNIAIQEKVASYDQMVVVHNGMPDVPQALRATHQDQRAKLVMVARFEEPKDQRAVIESLATIKCLDWSMDFIGDGPTLESAKSLVESLGLSKRVLFLGERDDVPECLSRSDALILVSRWEGLPLTILEAMRAGLPVVASDVGGVSEAVTDGVTGYLVPRNGRAELIESLRKIISEPEARVRMGEAGHLEFEREFTFEAMLHRTESVYLQALAVESKT
ncbi:glycosyltransferase family 4 protein [Marinobacter panjinensis]|uniref:Glycosyltransferase family 4 protein n=1 Tax=Marinobacter panjinensis TaxID=2576384 RepID=A0A4U6R261_9GAMM|nr:glycosyltransferase family 4 protein [Marinobacter panjinensis]MCR8913720.1 glycosyltransferase family 4 protein [Marinobacter panjinensis]TKV67630.1 glycosyltransferase family 4 protein [Marinobacter panjinensis]